jgi:AdoMet-dependent heme synthase
MNFDQAPLIVIWEVTQACDLTCVHCRASAMPDRHPHELTTEQGYQLLEQVRDFGSTGPMGLPMMIFTGGDPLKRPDLFDLMKRSVALGLRTCVSPSATPLLTLEAVRKFKEIGVARMAISLDGSDALSHDSFRGIPGTFDRAMIALKEAQRIGLETQLQTTVTRRNMHQLYDIARIAGDVGTRMWSLFFLIITGRAESADDLSAEEYEQVFEIMYQVAKTAPFDIKTTEAMHYRRYVAQRLKEEHRTGGEAEKVIFRTAGVSDGKGFVFISHVGEVYPSGFLPVSGGNVLTGALPDIYRTSPVFTSLRDTSLREGKCGYCEYVNLCGGSRARAFHLTGDYLAADPRCIYQPSEVLATRHER